VCTAQGRRFQVDALFGCSAAQGLGSQTPWDPRSIAKEGLLLMKALRVSRSPANVTSIPDETAGAKDLTLSCMQTRLVPSIKMTSRSSNRQDRVEYLVQADASSGDR
jgi:hypothetical protein